MEDMQKQAQIQGLTQTAQQTQTETKSGNKIAFREATAQDNELKEIYKILRRPRSRKYMKAMATMDVLSQGDEMIIEELKKGAAAGGAGAVGVTVDEASVADMVFTPADIESFKNSIAGIIAEEIRKEEEALRKAEEALREKKRRANNFLDIISNCGLPGCVVHRINRGGQILRHYTADEVAGMDVRYNMVWNILRQQAGWSYVEVYEGRLVHRNAGGDTIKIVELDEDDE